MNYTDPLDKKGRTSTVAGIYYPEDTEEIEKRIQSFNLQRGEGGTAAAIIAPYGAWDLSGAAASAAFRAAAGRDGITNIVLMGNIQDIDNEGIYLSESDYYDTPLGTIPVNRKIIRALSSCSTLLEINDIPHLRDYSLEVLLPFIKYAFPNAGIVPILMGYCWGNARVYRNSTNRTHNVLIPALTSALRIILEPIMDSTLLVVSSNLSHHEDERISQHQAELCIQLLESGDYNGFIESIHGNRLSICAGPILAALLGSGLLDDNTAKLVSPRPLGRNSGEEAEGITYFGGLSFG